MQRAISGGERQHRVCICAHQRQHREQGKKVLTSPKGYGIMPPVDTIYTRQGSSVGRAQH